MASANTERSHMSPTSVPHSQQDYRICLYLLLLLFLVLAALVIIKYFFIKNRRAQSEKSLVITTVPVDTPADNHGKKTAFLVGLFGSPVLETNVKQHIQQPSFTYQLHSKSLRRSAHTGSTSSKSQTSKHTQSSFSLSEALGSTTQSQQHGVTSLQSPAHPMKQHIRSATTLSLSSNQHSHRKRSTSLGANVSQGDQNSQPARSSNHLSLRLVEEAALNYSTATARFSDPILQYKLSSFESSPIVAHPLQEQPHASYHDGYSNMPTLDSKSARLSNLSDPTATRRPLSPLNGSPKSGTPEASPPRSKISPPNSSPFYPQPGATKKLFKKQNAARTRRNITLGPSPLRTMILPESFHRERNSSTDQLKSDDKENGCIEEASPQSGLKIACPVHKTNCRRADCDNLLNDDLEPASNYRKQDSNLLGIIRDLVEATKEWDQSLYMDENFKLLIGDRGLPRQTTGLLNTSAPYFKDSSDALVETERSPGHEQPSEYILGTGETDFWHDGRYKGDFSLIAASVTILSPLNLAIDLSSPLPKKRDRVGLAL